MENEIKVSILCTAYNHEKYIRKCLEGFVMQKTNFKFEVLINDDASTDNTAQIIREFEQKYPDIIKPIYQTENQYSKGVKITMEILAPKVKGKYVALCEGDDFWTDENKLQMQYDVMEENPDCKMCVHKVKGYYENIDKNEFYPPFHIETSVIQSCKFVEITHGYIFQTSSYLFDAQTFKEYATEMPLFRKISPVGDVCYLLYFANKGPVYYINKTMSCYRRFSEGSWSQKIKSKDKSAWNRYREKIIKVYEEFDKYSGGKFHEFMLLRIFYFQKQYKKIAFSKELRNWRKKQPTKKRVYLTMRAIFPRTVEKLLKNFK